MNEDEAFIRAIEASPDDDTIRLVYADWLDEHRRHEQADFLRLYAELNSDLDTDDESLVRLEILRQPMEHNVWLVRVEGWHEVVLEAFPPAHKLHVIRVIRQSTGCSLVRARHCSEDLPTRIPLAPLHSEAERRRQEFLSLGVVASPLQRNPTTHPVFEIEFGEIARDDRHTIYRLFQELQSCNPEIRWTSIPFARVVNIPVPSKLVMRHHDAAMNRFVERFRGETSGTIQVRRFPALLKESSS